MPKLCLNHALIVPKSCLIINCALKVLQLYLSVPKQRLKQD